MPTALTYFSYSYTTSLCSSPALYSYVQPFLVFDVLLWVRRWLSEFDCASVVGAASTIGIAALLRISTGWVGMCVNWSVHICKISFSNFLSFHSHDSCKKVNYDS